MRDRRDGLRTALAVVLLLIVGTPGHLSRIRETRTLAGRGAARDAAGRYDVSFGALKPFLPLKGRIGYVPPPDWPSVNAVQAFYLAEYSLTPRIVVLGVDAEFVIAVPEAGVRADTVPSDPRLAGLTVVRQFDDGLLLLRRLK